MNANLVTRKNQTFRRVNIAYDIQYAYIFFWLQADKVANDVTINQ